MTTLATDLYLLVAAFGLALPVSFARLPVLGQGAFVAVGAFGTVQLADHGTPLGLAVACAVAIAAVAGYVAGFAATRLEGAPLALATWGLAWLAYVVLVQFPTLSGGSQGLVRATPARLVSRTLGVVVTVQPWAHVVVAAIVDVALALVLWRAASGPWGLDWAAMRSGPALADSLGVPVQRRRRALLSVSAAIAAIGGAGTALLTGVVAPGDYSPLLSLQLFVAVLVGGTATWWGPALGVALLAALPSAADAIATSADIDPQRSRGVFTAALLVGALALRHPVARWLRRRGARRRAAPSSTVFVTKPDPAGRVLLRLRNVRVSYGAVVALDDVDLDLRAGEVHALIGPNGSGKSTVLRVATGIVGPVSGTVEIAGHAAPPPGSAAPRVRAGVVRTLQRTDALGGLPVDVQAQVGARARDRLAFAGLRDLVATPKAKGARLMRAAAAADALQATTLADRCSDDADTLDSAEQRLLQVARAVATGAPALLLDEPAAGMSRGQRDALVDVLRALARSGRGVLLVEHDMALVGRVADRVTVLAEGQVLASGAPADVRADPAVRRTYLGGAA